MAPVPDQTTDHPRRSRTGAVAAGLGLVAILAVALAGAAGRLGPTPTPVGPAPIAAQPASPAVPARPPERFTAVTAVVDALRGLFPFNRARPGDQLRVERREGERAPLRLSYRQGPADEWLVERVPDGTLRATKRPVALTTEVSRVAVTIGSSLYESLQKGGEDPNLAVLAADVLAWDVDFYQDVRAGDRMRMVVEKVFADGKLLRYGEVLAAEYEGAATGRKRLF